jgi:hypothetical protein
MYGDPGTPGGRTKDSPERVMSRPPEGARVGQSRPGPVEKHEDQVPGKPGEFGSSVAIEDTDAKPPKDNGPLGANVKSSAVEGYFRG